MPNTVNRAGAPGVALSLSSSTFAPDSPDGVAVPDSVNPPFRVLTEVRLMLEAGFGADRDPDRFRGRGHDALLRILELHLDVPGARAERRGDREVPWLVASRSVATFLNAPFAPTARANTVTVPLTCPFPGATVPSTSALPPCD